MPSALNMTEALPVMAVMPDLLASLRAAARGDGPLMEPLLDAVRAYATVGEMCDALREVWGEYTERAEF